MGDTASAPLFATFPRKRLYAERAICADCGSDFATAQNARYHQVNVPPRRLPALPQRSAPSVPTAAAGKASRFRALTSSKFQIPVVAVQILNSDPTFTIATPVSPLDSVSSIWRNKAERLLCTSVLIRLDFTPHSSTASYKARAARPSIFFSLSPF